MFWRAVLAFVAMPGIVAIAVPVLWLRGIDRLRVEQPLAILLLAAGLVGLLWCVRDFYVRGKGTLAPWAPPESLVVVGFYRFSRNPMYVSVVTILLGWALTASAPSLLAYAAGIALAFHLRVVYGEEPWLARRHGHAWTEYARRVPRWVGVVDRIP